MAITLPSEADAWIREWRRLLNENDDFAAAADGWGVGFDGDFVFVIRPDEQFPDGPLCFYVALEDGACTEAYRVADPDDEEYGFALLADYADWKRVIRGDLGAVEGVKRGVVDVRGSKLKLLQYADAAAELGATAAQVDTEFEY